jgi:hypothetical protein
MKSQLVLKKVDIVLMIFIFVKMDMKEQRYSFIEGLQIQLGSPEGIINEDKKC